VQFKACKKSHSCEVPCCVAKVLARDMMFCRCVMVCLGSDTVENYVVPCVSVCPWDSCGVEMWDVVT
jgi:hypothetical protein